MDTGALRQKILDLAIRGKLVPQDPNDEPASVLLERIRAEKLHMVKDGKLKAKDIKGDTIIFKGEDNLHYEKFQDGTVKCIEDEIPFEVPKGWAWERLGNITTIARGGSPRPIKAYITTADDGINWIKIGDTEKNGKYIFSTKEKIKSEGMSKSRYVKSGDFLLTNSMSFGRPYILRTDGCIHDGWLVIGNVANIFNQDYLYYALSADFMYKILAILAGGSTVDNLNSDLVKSVLFPIPPMKEQTSIAQRIECLLNCAEQIMQKQKSIEETIIQCKSKILDLAIRGKLVPQDPNDEPASVLLERIRAEKLHMVKDGKLKAKDIKGDTIIFKGDDNSYYEQFENGAQKNITDEIPFVVPCSWEWARLTSICSKIVDGDHNPPKGEMVMTPYIMASSKNINNDTLIDLNNVRYLSKENFDKVNLRTNVTVGDVLFTSVGSIGRSCIYNQGLNICFQRSVSIITSLIDNIFLKLILDSGVIQSIVAIESTGNAQLGFYLNQLGNLLIPIPPASEQKRISKIIDHYFSHVLVINSIVS